MPAFSQSYSRPENYFWVNAAAINAVQGVNGAGMYFNNDTVTSINTQWQPSGVYPIGSASICDKSGDILFYTNGVQVWDRNHQLMPHGADFNHKPSMVDTYFVKPAVANHGANNAAYNFDGVAIVPVPGSSHKYYIFSCPRVFVPDNNPNNSYIFTSAPQDKLYCTIIDMELNHGRGDVDTNFHGVVIGDGMAGNLEAVTGADCNYWLVGYGSDGSYKAYNITATGIDTTPVESILTPVLSQFVGELNISPDNHKAAMASWSEVQVSDFDPATGQFSNDILFGTQQSGYTAFSPNSQLVYFAGLIGLRQYDLNALSTPFNLLMINNYTAYELDAPLRLGPNGKIYYSYVSSTDTTGPWHWAASVNYPNVFGQGCQAELMADQNIRLIAGDWYPLYMFPNEVPVLVYDTVYSRQEVALCFGRPARLNPSRADGTDYHWMARTIGNTYFRRGTDTTSVLAATEPGIYAVQYFTDHPCQVHRDTFIVHPVNFSLYLGADTQTCDGTPVKLNTDISAAQYTWSDGSTGKSLLAETTGIYWVEVTKDGCTVRDSIVIDIINIRPDLGVDTTLCFEDAGLAVTLKANAPTGASVLWSTGSTEPAIQVSDSGLYWVRVTDKRCEGEDSMILKREYCDCPMVFPSAFTPNGDGLNDQFKPDLPTACPVIRYRMQIYNRYGQMIYVSYRPDEGWNGRYNGNPAELGVYYYRLKMKTGLRKQMTIRSGAFTLLR